MDFMPFNLGCDTGVPLHQSGVSSILNKTGCLTSLLGVSINKFLIIFCVQENEIKFVLPNSHVVEFEPVDFCLCYTSRSL
jgi:hypothetical protein